MVAGADVVAAGEPDAGAVVTPDVGAEPATPAYAASTWAWV